MNESHSVLSRVNGRVSYKLLFTYRTIRQGDVARVHVHTQMTDDGGERAKGEWWVVGWVGNDTDVTGELINT